MPIKGVSDIKRFPRLGKIKIGEKKLSKSGQEYPSATNYFVCPPEVQRIYGPKPKELDVVFPVDNEEVIFSQWYKRYGSSKGLVCKGDGEVAMATRIEAKPDGESVVIDEIECGGPECEAYQQKKCRRVGSLKFMLPKIGGVGIWQLDTSSFNSIVNINSTLSLIRAVSGKIALTPFKLCLEPQEVTSGGSKRKIHVLQLRAENINMFKGQSETEKAPPKLEGPSAEKTPLEKYKEAARKCKSEKELVDWFKSIKAKASKDLADKDFAALVEECAAIKTKLTPEGTPTALDREIHDLWLEMGNEEFYHILGGEGYNSVKEVKMAKKQKEFIEALKKRIKELKE